MVCRVHLGGCFGDVVESVRMSSSLSKREKSAASSLEKVKMAVCTSVGLIVSDHHDFNTSHRLCLQVNIMRS